MRDQNPPVPRFILDAMDQHCLWFLARMKQQLLCFPNDQLNANSAWYTYCSTNRKTPYWSQSCICVAVDLLITNVSFVLPINRSVFPQLLSVWQIADFGRKYLTTLTVFAPIMFFLSLCVCCSSQVVDLLASEIKADQQLYQKSCSGRS